MTRQPSSPNATPPQRFATIWPSGLLVIALCASCAAPTPTAPPVATDAPQATVTVTNPPVPTATAAPTLTPAPTPLPPHFTIGLPLAPGTLDPAQATDEAALLITRHLYEGLTAYAPGGTTVIPALATNWSTTDAVTWTFQLRSGVVFHDGTPFNALAVQRNFERWFHAAPPGAYVFWRMMFGGYADEIAPSGEPRSLLAGVSAVGTQTVLITLTRPYAALPNTLAMPSFAIVNPQAFKALEGLETTSAGTGPYQLAASELEAPLQLTQFAGYWGPLPLAHDLFFKPIEDDTQRLLALQSGEIEGLARLPAGAYPNLAQDPTYRLAADPALNVLYLGFNQARSPWDNLNCRRALAYALDRERYARAFFPQDAEAAYSFVPPAVDGATIPTTTLTYDAALAQSEWQACRSVEIIPLTVTLHLPPEARSYLPDPVGLGQAIQSDLTKMLSLNVQLVAPDWDTWLHEVYSGSRADLFLLGWTGVNGDPDEFLCPLFCGLESALNSDPEGGPRPPDQTLADLLLEARRTPDPARRRALYAEAQAQIALTIPALPLTHRNTFWVYAAALRGNVPSPLEDVFGGLYWERGP